MKQTVWFCVKITRFADRNVGDTAGRNACATPRCDENFSP